MKREKISELTTNRLSVYLRCLNELKSAGIKTVSSQELAEQFTTQKPALKVIYISGYSLQVAGNGFSVLDGLNFLQKPFDDTKLALAVRHGLDS